MSLENENRVPADKRTADHDKCDKEFAFKLHGNNIKM